MVSVKYITIDTYNNGFLIENKPKKSNKNIHYIIYIDNKKIKKNLLSVTMYYQKLMEIYKNHVNELSIYFMFSHPFLSLYNSIKIIPTNYTPEETYEIDHTVEIINNCKHIIKNIEKTDNTEIILNVITGEYNKILYSYREIESLYKILEDESVKYSLLNILDHTNIIYQITEKKVDMIHLNINRINLHSYIKYIIFGDRSYHNYRIDYDNTYYIENVNNKIGIVTKSDSKIIYHNHKQCEPIYINKKDKNYYDILTEIVYNVLVKYNELFDDDYGVCLKLEHLVYILDNTFFLKGIRSDECIIRILYNLLIQNIIRYTTRNIDKLIDNNKSVIINSLVKLINTTKLDNINYWSVYHVRLYYNLNNLLCKHIEHEYLGLEHNDKIERSCGIFNSIYTLTNWYEEINNPLGLVIEIEISNSFIVGTSSRVLIKYITTTLVPINDYLIRLDNDSLNNKVLYSGRTIGKGNAILPLYITQEHWDNALPYINLLLGQMITSNPILFTKRHMNIYFNALTIMTENLYYNINNLYIHLLVGLYRTCVEINNLDMCNKYDDIKILNHELFKLIDIDKLDNNYGYLEDKLIYDIKKKITKL